MCKYSVETIAAQAGNHIDDKKGGCSTVVLFFELSP